MRKQASTAFQIMFKDKLLLRIGFDQSSLVFSERTKAFKMKEGSTKM